MSAVTSSKMASEVDGTKRTIISMKTKRVNSTVLQRGWTELVVATLCVVVEILVLLLKKWTRPVRNEIRGFYDDLSFALSEATERLVCAVLAAGGILGIVIGEVSNVINELLGADLIAAMSDVVVDLETGPRDEGRASKTTVALKWPETAGYVLGRPANGEQQDQARLTLKNNSLRRDSDVRPTILQRQLPSRLVDEPTTERVENPENSAEIISNTPQPTVLKIRDVTYDTMPSNAAAGPIASFRPDKMAEWRRRKFFADVVPTVTAEIADTTMEQRRVTGCFANRWWRYFARPPAGRFRERGPVTTRPLARDDVARRRHVPETGVPSTAVPPPPDAVPLYHGQHGAHAVPPLPGPMYLSHGHHGPHAVPPPPGSVPLSHGHHGPYAGPPPSGPVPFSHGCHGPLAGPTPPSPAPYSYGHPGPFSGPRRFAYRGPGPIVEPTTHARFM